MYCDTSALLKLYVREAGSEAFNAATERRTDVFVSELTLTELVSALARPLRRGELRADAVRRIQGAIIRGIDNGEYRRVDLTPAVHRHAEHLLVTLRVPLRAADALHLALAGSARAATVATFDTRLAEAARAIGLLAYPR